MQAYGERQNTDRCVKRIPPGAIPGAGPEILDRKEAEHGNPESTENRASKAHARTTLDHEHPLRPDIPGRLERGNLSHVLPAAAFRE